MVNAERRLLAYALKDTDNQHFVLLSDRLTFDDFSCSLFLQLCHYIISDHVAYQLAVVYRCVILTMFTTT